MDKTSHTDSHEPLPAFASRDTTVAGGSPAVDRRPAADGSGDGDGGNAVRRPTPATPHRHDTTPSLSIRFAVHPHTTVTWKITSDSTLRVCRERIWLTRAHSPYDHWLGPGDTLGLARGERIWLSSDAPGPAEVTLTSAWSRRRTVALAWIEWFAGWSARLAPRRAR